MDRFSKILLARVTSVFLHILSVTYLFSCKKSVADYCTAEDDSSLSAKEYKSWIGTQCIHALVLLTGEFIILIKFSAAVFFPIISITCTICHLTAAFIISFSAAAMCSSSVSIILFLQLPFFINDIGLLALGRLKTLREKSE